MSEKRYIDLNDSFTLNASDNTGYSLCFGGGIISVMDARGSVVCEFFADDAIPAKVEPVAQAHWIEKTEQVSCRFKNITVRRYSCSGCGAKYPPTQNILGQNRCPNCGAHMKGGDANARV